MVGQSLHVSRALTRVNVQHNRSWVSRALPCYPQRAVMVSDNIARTEKLLDHLASASPSLLVSFAKTNP